MIPAFRHLDPARRLFQGADSLQRLAHELDRLGSKRAMVVCGATLGRGAGELVALRDALGPRCVGVYSGVQAHSPLPSVLDAARQLADARADAVVAVGGGSAIVTARVAGILLAEGGDARRLCTTRGSDGRFHSPQLAAPKLPQLVIPTTPTTAAVKAGGAVLDPALGERLTFFDPKIRAHAVFIHPDFLVGAPFDTVQNASLNALAMAVEGLESDVADPMADALLMHAIALLAENLPHLQSMPDSAAVRAHLVAAAALCGQGTDHTSGGLASVLGHAIGARFHVDNGLVNAIVLPHTLRFNSPATASRRRKLLRALGMTSTDGENGSDAAMDSVDRLLTRLLLPRRLRDVGVPQAALPDIAGMAMNDWFVQTNPRPIRGVHDVMAVLDAAW